MTKASEAHASSQHAQSCLHASCHDMIDYLIEYFIARLTCARCLVWLKCEASAQAGGQGEPVVLVHGFGASARQWRRTMPVLAQHHKARVRMEVCEGQPTGLTNKPRVAGCSEGTCSHAMAPCGKRGAALLGNSADALSSTADLVLRHAGVCNRPIGSRLLREGCTGLLH